MREIVRQKDRCGGAIDYLFRKERRLVLSRPGGEGFFMLVNGQAGLPGQLEREGSNARSQRALHAFGGAGNSDHDGLDLLVLAELNDLGNGASVASAKQSCPRSHDRGCRVASRQPDPLLAKADG